MKKVLISGAKGQLVTDIIKLIDRNPEYDVYAYDREGWSVRDHDRSIELFDGLKPDVYINGASYHVVNDIVKNPDLAAQVNIASLHILSNLCNDYNCKMVNFSTNYVFDNSKNTNTPTSCHLHGFSEMVTPLPCNIYGIMKYAGEQIVEQTCNDWLNIRVAGLFGKSGSRAKNGDHFIYMVLRQIAAGEKLTIVNDQYMNIGYTVDLAKAVMNCINGKSIYPNDGLYHIANEGIITWYELAKFICDIKGYDNIEPVSSDDFFSNIKRPMRTGLICSKYNNSVELIDKLPNWQSGVVRFLKEIGEI
jgi:dTDP-4-dehydrorhamnose reductase